MNQLFKAAVSHWMSKALGKLSDIGLYVLAIDDTTFRCHDLQENAEEFYFKYEQTLSVT